MSFTQTIRKTLVMLTPTGKEIRAPETLLLPMTKAQAADWEALRKHRDSQTGKASS